jgi:hypothetical protein
MDSASRKRSSSAKLITSYKHLTQSDIDYLTQILSHQPPPHSSQLATYKSLTLAQIQSLPPHLLRNSHGPPATGVASLFPKPRHQGLHYTCPVHTHLPYRLQRSLYRVLRHDIATALPASLAEVARHHEGAATIFRQLREASTMFLADAEYLEAWGTLPPPERERDRGRWAPQKDGCAACVLARIGGDERLVTALRTGVLSRLRDGMESKRLSWLESWMRGFEDGDTLMEESNQLAQEIRQSKKQGNAERKLAVSKDLSGLHAGDWENRHEADDQTWLAGLKERVEKWRNEVQTPTSEVDLPSTTLYSSSVYSQESGFHPKTP